MRWQSLNESLYLLVSKNTALWELKATSWMPHQQVPQIKAKATVKEYGASLSKDYRPVAAASCVLGQKMMCQCRGPPWFSPGSQTEVWVSVSWEAFSAIAVKWNWPGKQTRSLSISRPSMSGWWVFLLFCLFACLVWNPWIPSMEHSEEKRRNEGRRGEERWGRGECVGGGRCVTRRPPLEVTRDLPWSYRAKLLNKYTQTPGSGQQRRIAVSDPSTDVISDTRTSGVLIHGISMRTFQICFTVRSERHFCAMCETFMCKSNCRCYCNCCSAYVWWSMCKTKCFTAHPVSDISHNDCDWNSVSRLTYREWHLLAGKRTVLQRTDHGERCCACIVPVLYYMNIYMFYSICTWVLMSILCFLSDNMDFMS